MELLAKLVGEPLVDLLTPNLPTCMVLILASYAQGRPEDEDAVAGDDQERAAQASASHNLLLSLLGKEVCERRTDWLHSPGEEGG